MVQCSFNTKTKRFTATFLHAYQETSGKHTMQALIGRGLSKMLVSSVLSCGAVLIWTVFTPPPLY